MGLTNPSSMSKFEIQAFPLFKNFYHAINGTGSVLNQKSSTKNDIFSQNKQVSSGPPFRLLPTKPDEICRTFTHVTALNPNMMQIYLCKIKYKITIFCNDLKTLKIA